MKAAKAALAAAETAGGAKEVRAALPLHSTVPPHSGHDQPAPTPAPPRHVHCEHQCCNLAPAVGEGGGGWGDAAQGRTGDQHTRLRCAGAFVSYRSFSFCTGRVSTTARLVSRVQSNATPAATAGADNPTGCDKVFCGNLSFQIDEDSIK